MHSKTFFEAKNFLILLILVSFISGVFFILLGQEFLIKNGIVLDDTFIGLAVSKNLFLGKGFSFNGLELTSGNPFLWSSFLVLFGFLDKINFLLTSLTFSHLFFVLSAIPIYLLANFIFHDTKKSLLTVFLFLFNPFYFLISLNGLETSMFLFFSSWVFFYYISRVREKPFVFKKAFIFALLVILTILSREEGVLIFAACLLDFVLMKPKNLFKKTAIILLLFIMLYVPIILWRYFTFGHLIPSSLSQFFFTNLQYGPALRRILFFPVSVYMINLLQGSIFLSIIGFFFMKRQESSKMTALISYVIFAIFFYSFVVPSSKLRYLFPASVFLTFAVAQMFFILFEKFKSAFFISKHSSIAIAIALALYVSILSTLALQSWNIVYLDSFSRDTEIGAAHLDIYYIHAAQFINNKLPSNARVAAGHIGTLGYFSNVPIIDYGGKVSYQAIQAMQMNKTYEFLLNNSVQYLAIRVSPFQIDTIDRKDILFSEPVIYNGVITGYVLVLNLNQRYL